MDQLLYPARSIFSDSVLPSKVGKVLTQLHVKLLLVLELFRDLYFMMFNGLMVMTWENENN